MNTQQAKPAAAADWFHNLVVSGMQQLYTLSLQGCPAAEVLPLTAVSWVDALWRAKPWDEALDARRLAAGFSALAASSERWPAPRELLTRLPPRREPVAAIAEPVPQRSAEQRAAFLAARDRLVARMTNPMRNATRSPISAPDLEGASSLHEAPACGTLSPSADATATVATAQQPGSNLS